MQIGLGPVLVAEVAHAQAGGVWAVERAGHQRQQLGLAALQKRLAQRRRGTKEVGDQPAVAQKIANQAKVALTDKVQIGSGGRTQILQNGPERLWQGPVVVGASNRLHVATVTQAQSLAIDRLEPGGMRVAVIGNRDIGLSAELTGHRAGPHQLVTELMCAVTVQLPQKRERKRAVLRGWCDELQQRFGIVGGDPGVGQLGAKRQRVGCGGQLAVGVHAQAFALVTTRDA